MEPSNGHANGETCPVAQSQGLLPNKPLQCKWALGTKEVSPHTCRETKPRPKIMPNILHAVGNTPVVKLNKIPQAAGIKCDVFVKCEFFSPAGSIKDRIALRMVEDAEEKGLLKPGSTIIEATSGNTGLGLAMACAVKNYKCVIVISEKMSNEKIDTLRALGTEIVRIPIGVSSDAPNGLFAVAERIRKCTPNSVILNQYKNEGNGLAHYDGTAFEILDAFDGSIDMVVMGAGTGGTVTGVGRKIKEACPDCKIVAIDPYGSILAQPSDLNKTDVDFYEIEGVGYDFIPTALDRRVVDKWYKMGDKPSFAMALRLIKEEGLLCGGSSGFVVHAALQAARELKEGQKCVILLPDGLRNYMTKFLDPVWLEARGLQEPEERPFPWWKKAISSFPVSKINSILPTQTIKEAISLMKTEKINDLPVIERDGTICGTISLKHIMKQINLLRATLDDKVAEALYTSFRKVIPETTLGLVSRILERESFVMVVDEKHEKYLGLISTIDFLQHIA